MALTLCGSGIIHCHGLDLTHGTHGNGHASDKHGKQETYGAANARQHNGDYHLRTSFSQEFKYRSA
jgi:hypothetical protein